VSGLAGAQLLIYDLLVGGMMWMPVATLALGGLLRRRSAPRNQGGDQSTFAAIV
jgi:hypothetical protein